MQWSALAKDEKVASVMLCTLSLAQAMHFAGFKSLNSLIHFPVCPNYFSHSDAVIFPHLYSAQWCTVEPSLGGDQHCNTKFVTSPSHNFFVLCGNRALLTDNLEMVKLKKIATTTTTRA